MYTYILFLMHKLDEEIKMKKNNKLVNAKRQF